MLSLRALFFFFNDTATTEIYTLSLHDALPIYLGARVWTIERLPDLLVEAEERFRRLRPAHLETRLGDRKSTRLNSSHSQISYAVFCLKKKKYRCTRPVTRSEIAPTASRSFRQC